MSVDNSTVLWKKVSWGTVLKDAVFSLELCQQRMSSLQESIIFSQKQKDLGVPCPLAKPQQAVDKYSYLDTY